jgi:hypothetical protein
MTDKRYRIHKLSEQEQTKYVYEKLKSDFEVTGYFKIVEGNNEYKVYNPELAVILITDNLSVYDTVLNLDAEIDSKAYFKAFKEGYKKGGDYFNNEVKASKEVIYGSNADVYVNVMHNNYFHNKHYKDFSGWNFIKQPFHNQLTNKEIEVWGYYSGLVNELLKFVKENADLFKKFEVCEHAPRLSKGISITENDNWGILEVSKIIKSHDLFKDKLFDMEFSDYVNCFNLNYPNPVHPVFKKNQITKFVYFLSQCPKIENENKVFLARFGIIDYKVKKQNTKPDQVFINQIKSILK